MKRRVMAAGAALVLAVLFALLTVDRAPQLPPASKRLVEASAGLDEIGIEARLDPDRRTLQVHQTLRLKNRTGERQSAATLRTWPNAFQNMDTSPLTAEQDLYEQFYPDGFSMGALVMSRAQVQGESVLYRYTDEAKTVLKTPIPGGWEADAWVEIELDYTVQIPKAAYRFGYWDGVYALGNAFAIPAVSEDPYAPVGDPFASECANYAVAVTVPDRYTCSGSGYPAVETANGLCTYRFSSPAVRDFALVIAEKAHTAQALEGNVLVTAHAATAAEARELLKYGRQALACYTSLWGEYPYQSYTLSQMHMPLGGMEYPALSMIASGQTGRELEYAVAHETAHQWWGVLVGSDGYREPWLDEAVSEYAVLEYAEKTYGLAERNDLEYSRMESAMRVTVSPGATPGAPLTHFGTMSEYSLVVYHRGAAYLCAVDRLLNDGINPFLRQYAQTYAFSIADREGFHRALLQATGEDLTPLARDYLDTTILH